MSADIIDGDGNVDFDKFSKFMHFTVGSAIAYKSRINKMQFKELSPEVMQDLSTDLQPVQSCEPSWCRHD